MWLILLLCAAAQHSALATSFPDWPKRFADEDYPKPKFACKSEADCMFLGECSRDGTQCVCKEGFAGSRCHELDLLPTKLEYGFNNPNFPSWGGVVTRINDKYHMFASYMVNKCDLYSYGTNSAVLRGLSFCSFITPALTLVHTQLQPRSLKGHTRFKKPYWGHSTTEPRLQRTVQTCTCLLMGTATCPQSTSTTVLQGGTPRT